MPITADKLSFHADNEQVVPLAPPVAVRAVIDIEAGHPIEGRHTRSAKCRSRRPAPTHHGFWFLDDAQLQPFSRAVFSRLVGYPDR